jgi:hypothetical protein
VLSSKSLCIVRFSRLHARISAKDAILLLGPVPLGDARVQVVQPAVAALPGIENKHVKRICF